MVGMEVGWVGMAKLRHEDLAGYDKGSTMGRQWGVLSPDMISCIFKKEFSGVLWRTDYMGVSLEGERLDRGLRE